MLAAVVSDTHRYKFAISKVINKVKNADILIHLGDNIDDAASLSSEFSGKIISVRGNCDFSNKIESECTEIIEGKTFFITHGHKYDVKYSIDTILDKGKSINADIVLYGHTHISQIEYIDGIWIVNPGSPSLPRDGFPSIATIEIDGGKIVPSILRL
ncbi:MAG: metallophosphoesterase [Bacillota bacterium]|nr:metallophosphoesterase [Bacillota bacterium]